MHDRHAMQFRKNESVKSYPFMSQMAHGAARISVSLALSLSLQCETTDTGLVYRAVCPFTLQFSLAPIAPTHGGMARLS